MKRLVSTIKLFRRDAANEYQVVIKHGDHEVSSGWYLDAQRAYANAECKLVIKPGYVQSVHQ